MSEGITEQRHDEVAAAVTDLLFATKIRSTAKELDIPLYVAKSVIELRELLDRHELQCVIVDMSVEGDWAIEAIEASCNRNGGSGPIPAAAARQLESISKILNIGWIAEGAKQDATIICPRSSGCPRDKHCLGKATPKLKSQIDDIRDSVLSAN